MIRCRQCNSILPTTRRTPERGLVCPQCGAGVKVSATYARTLIITSWLLGFSIPWQFIFHRCVLCAPQAFPKLIGVLAMTFPAAFLILFILVRLVPFVVPPPLVVRKDHATSILGL